jgi:hypothetical protein
MRLSALLLSVALAAAGCASAGQTDGGDSDDTVQLTVVNEYVGTVTAFAVWGSGRTRLGDIGQNRTRTFFAPVQGNALALGLQLIGAPPAATSGGPPALSSRSGRAPDPSAPYVVSEETDIVAGDALEFRYSAAGILTIRRLGAGR